jgi:hypothetical protein
LMVDTVQVSTQSFTTTLLGTAVGTSLATSGLRTLLSRSNVNWEVETPVGAGI